MPSFHNSHYEKFLATGEVKCIDEEIPFEIPEGWEWERFGNVMINKDSERVPLSVAQRQHLKKTYDYYGASGVIDKVDKYLFDRDLLLIGEDGANLINRSTPIAFIAKGKYWVNNHAHVLDVCGGIEISYVALFINAISLVNYVTGTAQPKMNQEKMNSILLAIPPTKEQYRIVEKVSMVDAFIVKYASLQNKLDSLDNSVYELLKKSIIQEAIQGRLVPQDPSDEPASELLKRIREEKLRLVKEGKLKKKEITDSVIFKGDDNRHYEKIGGQIIDISEDVPFDIPDSWSWVRVSSIAKLISGTSYDKGDVTAKGIRILRGTNIVNFSVEFKDDDVFLPLNYFDGEKIISDGDIVIVGSTGSFTAIGRPAFIHGTHLYTQIGAFLRIVRSFSDLTNLWLAQIFKSQYYRSCIADRVKGTSINNIKAEYILNMLVPLPPYNEQRRIVQRINELFAKL